jgi:uncharacterized protein with HEPN domain
MTGFVGQRFEMPNQDVRAMRHMQEFAREALALLGDRSSEDLRHDRLRELAIRQLIVWVGSAARAVSSRRRTRETQIPWHVIIPAGDRTLHGYDVVDAPYVCDIVTQAFPSVIEALERSLPPASDGE